MKVCYSSKTSLVPGGENELLEQKVWKDLRVEKLAGKNANENHVD